MLSLYYAPNACSISPHVALREAGLPFELVRVDFMRGKRLPDGTDLVAVNPKGYVPALRLENGELLTEGAVMVQYIADRVPEAKLLPPAGTFERVRAQEWLNYIATELHKGTGLFFSQKANEEAKAEARDKLVKRFAVLSKGLEGRTYLLGDTFSVVDGYAFYALRVWKNVVKADLREYPVLHAYYERLATRPSIAAALEAEGIEK